MLQLILLSVMFVLVISIVRTQQETVKFLEERVDYWWNQAMFYQEQWLKKHEVSERSETTPGD